MPVRIRLVQVEAKSSEFHLGFPVGWQKSISLSHSVPPGCACGKQDKNKHSEMEYRYPKLKLNPLCLNSCIFYLLGVKSIWMSDPLHLPATFSYFNYQFLWRISTSILNYPILCSYDIIIGLMFSNWCIKCNCLFLIGVNLFRIRTQSSTVQDPKYLSHVQ